MDALLYSKNRLMETLDIEENLHSEIFKNNPRINSYKSLKKADDFYKTDVTYVGNDLDSFLRDLQNVKTILSDESVLAIDQLLEMVSSNAVDKIRITGD